MIGLKYDPMGISLSLGIIVLELERRYWPLHIAVNGIKRTTFLAWRVVSPPLVFLEDGFQRKTSKAPRLDK
jgi:hypothetical protein